MPQPDQHAIAAFIAIREAQAACAAPDAGDAEGEALMRAYAQGRALARSTPEAAFVKTMVILCEGAVAYPEAESGLDFDGAYLGMFPLMPAALRAAL